MEYFQIFCGLILTPYALGVSVSQCGRRKTSRIVGGQATSVNEFPMMAGLLCVPRETIYCGASIINQYFAVTAAHCFRNPDDLQNISLIVAEHDQRVLNESGYTWIYDLKSALIHPGYDASTGANDISIARTWLPIDYNVAVGRVCLPINNDQYVGKRVEAAGWGLRSGHGKVAPIINKAVVNVMANEKCANYYGKLITKGHICIFTQSRDICKQDSGGPLYYASNGYLYLVGIITFGGSCQANTPSGGVRVSEYVEWIIENTAI